MSKKEKTNSEEGYVVEGKLSKAVKGHLVLYSLTGGRVSYSAFARNARQLKLNRTFIPPIRRTKDAFAIAKNALNGMHLSQLESQEGWDGVVNQSVRIVPLKKGNEYAVQIKRTGRSRGKLHTESVNLFRLSFSPPEKFDAAAWCEKYMKSHWDDKVERPTVTDVRKCLSIEPYWDDQMFDATLMMQIQNRLLDEFEIVATSIDAKMLRDRIRKILSTEMKGLPFRSGQGAWFIPSDKESDHLEQLENYSQLLETFGNANSLVGEPTEETWLDETGKPRSWFKPRTNLRILGYIDNDRQLGYIRQDIETNLSREIAEYHSKVLNVANSFNKDKVKEFEKRLNSVQVVREDLQNRLKNLSDMIGGVEVNTVIFNDVNEGLTQRLQAIAPMNNSVVNRLRGLMSITTDEEEEEESDGLGDLFG